MKSHKPQVTPNYKKSTGLKLTASVFEAIFQSTVDAIITIDNKGLILSFNSAAESMFAYSAEQVIGQNIKMLMPSPYNEDHDGYLKRSYPR